MPVSSPGRYVRIGDRGINVPTNQRWITCEDGLPTLSIGEVVQNDRFHDPRSANAGLAVTHAWINADSTLPFHANVSKSSSAISGHSITSVPHILSQP